MTHGEEFSRNATFKEKGWVKHAVNAYLVIYVQFVET